MAKIPSLKQAQGGGRSGGGREIEAFFSVQVRARSIVWLQSSSSILFEELCESLEEHVEWDTWQEAAIDKWGREERKQSLSSIPQSPLPHTLSSHFL